jgi:hypothetical protein
MLTQTSLIQIFQQQRHKFTHSFLRHYMKLSVELHAAASLPSRIQLLTLNGYPNCQTLASYKNTCNGIAT